MSINEFHYTPLHYFGKTRVSINLVHEKVNFLTFCVVQLIQNQHHALFLELEPFAEV